MGYDRGQRWYTWGTATFSATVVPAMGRKGGAMGPLPQPSSRPRRISRALLNSNKCLDCRSTDVVQYGKQAQGTQR